MEGKTLVVFRTWKTTRFKGDTFALMPTEPADITGRYCTSYEQVGQHGAADYDACIARTRPATPEEYAPLLRELTSPPYRYDFIVRTRWNRNAYPRK